MTGLTQFNNTVTQYVYDNANRLTSITSPVANYSFILDDNGKRISSTQTTPAVINVNASSTSFTMNPQKNRLAQAGSDTLQYNNEGELASKGTNSYTFDDAHRLITATNGTDSYQYTYDGAGNRIAATRDGVTTKYIYDASGNLIAEADGSGTITRYYIYGAGLLAMVPNDNQNQLYCYHFDGTGDTVALTDSSANVVDSYAYTPFGAVTQNETVEQPFKFVGQAGVMAEPNGFYYMKARYYDSGVGRFISEDPKGFDGGDVNLSAYVGNNPIMGADPLGLSCNKVQAGAGAVVFAGGVLQQGLGLLTMVEGVYAIRKGEVEAGAHLLATGGNMFIVGGGIAWAGGKIIYNSFSGDPQKPPQPNNYIFGNYYTNQKSKKRP
jgi:RHS repeat-associated protein